MHLILIDSLHIDRLVYFVAEVYRSCKARKDLPFIYLNLTSIHSNDDERMLAHSCLSTNALLVEKSRTFTSLRRTRSMNKTAALARSYLHFGFSPLKEGYYYLPSMPCAYFGVIVSGLCDENVNFALRPLKFRRNFRRFKDEIWR